MSYWEKLLSSAPENEPWPRGFAESCASLSDVSTPVAFKCERTPAHLPSVSVRRQTSAPRSRTSSLETLSIEIQPQSGNSDRSKISPIPTPQSPQSPLQGESCNTSSAWGTRGQRGFVEAPEWQDGRRRRMSSVGVVFDSVPKELVGACLDDHERDLRTTNSERKKSPRPMKEDERSSAFVDLVCRGVSSDINSASQASESIELELGNAYPIVTPPTTEGRCDFVQWTGKASTAYSCYRHRIAETQSLPSLGRVSPETMHGRGEIERINDKHPRDSSKPKELDNATKLRSWRDLAKELMPEGDGSVYSSDARRKAFHNFVYRRQRTRNYNASPVDSSLRDSASDASLGYRDSSITTCNHEGWGNSLDERTPAKLTRRRESWKTFPVQERWDRSWVPGQTKRRCPPPKTTSGAFSALSIGGNRKLGCCGTDEKQLKCQRCGSLRIRLFATPLLLEPAQTNFPGVRNLTDDRSKSANLLLIAPVQNGADFDVKPCSQSDGTCSSPRPAVSGVIKGTAGGRGHRCVNARSTNQQEGWKRGWRHRGSSGHGDPGLPSGNSMLVPARRL